MTRVIFEPPLDGSGTKIMKGADRKAAVAAYKERKVAAGIYAMHCVPTGQRWVGHAPDLATILNRVTFALRQGGSPFPSLQAAWRDHGAEAFAFEIIERFEDKPDDTADAYVRNRAAKARVVHWCTELGAEAI